MDAQLRSGPAADGERGDRNQFAAFEVEGGPRIEIAERELDHHPGEIGRDLGHTAFHEMGNFVRRKLLGNVDASIVTITQLTLL